MEKEDGGEEEEAEEEEEVWRRVVMASFHCRTACVLNGEFLKAATSKRRMRTTCVAHDFAVAPGNCFLECVVVVRIY